MILDWLSALLDSKKGGKPVYVSDVRTYEVGYPAIQTEEQSVGYNKEAALRLDLEWKQTEAPKN